MKYFLKKLFNQIYLFFVNDPIQNFNYFACKLEEKYPKGLLLIHEGIEFFVKDFSSSPDFLCNNLFPEENKLYIVTEYFDKEEKIFIEKYFHEDFFKNRYEVYTGVLDNRNN